MKQYDWVELKEPKSLQSGTDFNGDDLSKYWMIHAINGDQVVLTTVTESLLITVFKHDIKHWMRAKDMNLVLKSLFRNTLSNPEQYWNAVEVKE